MSTSLQELRQAIDKLKQIESTKRNALDTLTEQIKLQKELINDRIKEINSVLLANDVEEINLLADDEQVLEVNHVSFLKKYEDLVQAKLQEKHEFITNYELLLSIKQYLYDLKTLALDALSRPDKVKLEIAVKNLPHQYGIKPEKLANVLGKKVDFTSNSKSNLNSIIDLVDKQSAANEIRINKSIKQYDMVQKLNQFQDKRRELLGEYEKLIDYNNQLTQANNLYVAPEVFAALEEGVGILDKLNTEHNDNHTIQFIQNMKARMLELMTASPLKVDAIKSFNASIASSYELFMLKSEIESIPLAKNLDDFDDLIHKRANLHPHEAEQCAQFLDCVSMLKNIMGSAIPGKDEPMVLYINENILSLNKLMKQNPMDLNAINKLHKEIFDINKTIVKEVNAVLSAAKNLIGKMSFFTIGIQRKYNNIVDTLRTMSIKERATVMTGPKNAVQFWLANKRGHWRFKPPTDDKGKIVTSKAAKSYKEALDLVEEKDTTLGEGLGKKK